MSLLKPNSRSYNHAFRHIFKIFLVFSCLFQIISLSLPSTSVSPSGAWGQILLIKDVYTTFLFIYVNLANSKHQKRRNSNVCAGCNIPCPFLIYTYYISVCGLCLYIHPRRGLTELLILMRRQCESPHRGIGGQVTGTHVFFVSLRFMPNPRWL